MSKVQQAVPGAALPAPAVRPGATAPLASPDAVPAALALSHAAQAILTAIRASRVSLPE